MRSGSLGPAISLLLCCSQKAYAADEVYLSGPVSACQGYHLTNATSVNASLTPANATLSLAVSGLSTVSGNATLGIALFTNSDEVYKAIIDPCGFSLPLPDLCPASAGLTNLSNINLNVPEDNIKTIGLSSLADVRAQVSIDISGTDGRVHMVCVETTLHSNGSDDADGSGNGSNNDTAGNVDSDSNNATSSDGGDSSDDTTQNSSAGTLQAVGYLSICAMVIWLL